MFNKIAMIAAAILAVSASGANAQIYNIAITGSCDTETLTVAKGTVVGQSNADNCDTSNLVGYEAKLKADVGPGGKVLIASGDLGLSPDAWSWAFNLKTKEATLTGTPDGTTIYQATFSFTYTKDADRRNNGMPSAASSVLRQIQH